MKNKALKQLTERNVEWNMKQEYDLRVNTKVLCRFISKTVTVLVS